MTSPNWAAEVQPGTGLSMVEAVLAPTIGAVGIRSDDRISASAASTSSGALAVTLGIKPPGEWQWTDTGVDTVELVMEQSGQVRCHLLRPGHSDERQLVDDSQAATALALNQPTWLAIRAIVETGLADTARMTATDADRAAANPGRPNPQAIAHKLAELTRQAGSTPTIAASMTGPEDPPWESINSLPTRSHQRALRTTPRERPLGPAL